MEWSTTSMIDFIQAYKAEPCIWNPNNPNYKNKVAMLEAWDRIRTKLDNEYPLIELKRKKESLMASYRSIIRKRNAYANQGVEMCISWYAFKYLDEFLGPLYANPKSSIADDAMESENSNSDLLDDSVVSVKDENITVDEGENNFEMRIHERPFDHLEGAETINENAQCAKCDRLQKKLNSLLAEKRLNESARMCEKRPRVEEDETELFAKLIVKKLRRFGEMQKERVMNEIDNVIFKHRMEKMQNESSNAQPASSEADN